MAMHLHRSRYLYYLFFPAAIAVMEVIAVIAVVDTVATSETSAVILASKSSPNGTVTGTGGIIAAFSTTGGVGGAAIGVTGLGS
jgi:ABC-type uncharacterized transport system substrate-binding protein